MSEYTGQKYPSERDEKHVRETLERAGWYPGRQVEAQVEAWSKQSAQHGLVMFKAARDALLEFGGTQVDVQGSSEGINVAKLSFLINPESLLDDAYLMEQTSLEIGHKMYPIGELEGGYPYLAIDDRGWVFILHEKNYLVAKSMAEALGCLLLGLRPYAGEG